MKKILLLNLIPNTIGDNILITPLLSILNKNNPDAKIDLTASSLNADLFLNNPYINKLHIIDELKYIADKKKSKISKFFIYLKIIFKYSMTFKKEKYNSCFILLPNFSLNVLIPFFAGIKERIGYSYKGDFLSFLLSKKTKYRGLFETKEYERHFIESYLDLLRVANIKFKEEEVICKVYLANEEKYFYKIFKDKGLIKNRYLCFQAGSKDNSWDITNFIALAKMILKKYPYKIVLLGSNSEYSLNNQLSDVDKRIINLCSETTIQDKAFLLKKSILSICNDSGLAHLSSSVGAKTIVLYGPHSPKHSIPLGTGKVFPVYKYYNKFPYVKRGSIEGVRRINKIKPEEVFEKVKEILD